MIDDLDLLAMAGPEDQAAFKRDVRRIKKENTEMFQEFAGYLVNHDFEGDSIKSCVANMDVYLNHFLVYFDPADATEVQDGLTLVDEFFEEWLPEQNDNITTTVADFLESIGLFYKWLSEETGVIDESDFEAFVEFINYRKDSWL